MNEMDEKLKALSEQLEIGIKSVFSSDKYRDYLDTMSKFHRYSFRNSILIFQQNPHATYVAGFNAWKSMERSVNKGEKGLQILAPAPYKRMVTVTRDEAGNLLPEPQQKEVTVNAYRPAYVFDVSQTQGKELPRLVTQLMGTVQGHDELMYSLYQASPYTVSLEAMEGNKNGYCNFAEQRIAIREGMSEVQTIKTLVHEIAHARLGHGGNRDIDRRTGEVQAESVAYVVCRHLGIDSSQYSFGYVASWSQDKEVPQLIASLETIQKTARNIIEDVDRQLVPLREQRKDIAQVQGKDQSAQEHTNEDGYKLFYSGQGGQDKEAHAYQRETGWNMAWGSDNSGFNGDTWIAYRDIKDLPKRFQSIVSKLQHEVKNTTPEQQLEQENKKLQPNKSKKRGVLDRLEVAKQQVAERAAVASPQEHTKNRSSGHSR